MFGLVKKLREKDDEIEQLHAEIWDILLHKKGK